MAASQNGHVDVVKTLLEHGARVDLQDEVGSLFLVLCKLPQKHTTTGRVEPTDGCISESTFHGGRNITSKWSKS